VHNAKAGEVGFGVSGLLNKMEEEKTE